MTTVEFVQLTNRLIDQLKDIIIDPVTEAMLLANAMDWAQMNNIRFVWFMENAHGLTHNGLSLINERGEVIHDIIIGFDDEDDKLLSEALTAQEAMYMEEMDND